MKKRELLWDSGRTTRLSHRARRRSTIGSLRQSSHTAGFLILSLARTFSVSTYCESCVCSKSKSLLLHTGFVPIAVPLYMFRTLSTRNKRLLLVWLEIKQYSFHFGVLAWFSWSSHPLLSGFRSLGAADPWPPPSAPPPPRSVREVAASS